MKIGIDRLHLYSSHCYVDLKTLATERGVDVDKFYRNWPRADGGTRTR